MYFIILINNYLLQLSRNENRQSQGQISCSVYWNHCLAKDFYDGTIDLGNVRNFNSGISYFDSGSST